MGLRPVGGSDARFLNVSLDKASGVFYLDDRDGANKRALADVKSQLGYEKTDGYQPEMAKDLKPALKERGVDIFSEANGKFAGVSVYNKEDSRYFKVRLEGEGEDGKKEIITLSYSVSNTHEGNNSHITGAIIALDKVKPGDLITVSSYASLQKDQDGNPRLDRNGKEVYRFATNVYEGERKRGDKPISTAGDARWKFKEAFADKEAGLKAAGLDDKTVNKTLGGLKVARLMEYAEELEKKVPMRSIKHEEDHFEAAEDPVMPADKPAESAAASIAPDFDDEY